MGNLLRSSHILTHFFPHTYSLNMFSFITDCNYVNVKISLVNVIVKFSRQGIIKDVRTSTTKCDVQLHKWEYISRLKFESKTFIYDDKTSYFLWVYLPLINLRTFQRLTFTLKLYYN